MVLSLVKTYLHKFLHTGAIRLLLFVLICVSTHAFGQLAKREADSLKRQIDDVNPGVRIRQYLRLAHIYAERFDSDSLLHYSLLVEETIKEIPDSTQFTHLIYSWLLWSHNIKGDYEKGIPIAAKLDDELKRIEEEGNPDRYVLTIGPHRTELFIDYNSLYDFYRKIGDYEKAYYYVIKAIDQAERVGVEYGMADSYNNLGIVYDLQGDYENAVINYRKAIDINLVLGETREWKLGTNYNNLGIVLKNLEKYDSSELAYNRALDIMEARQSEYGKAVILDNLGALFHAQGQYAKAVSHHKKGLDIMKRLGSREQESQILLNMASSQFKLQEVDEAEQNALAAYEIAQKDGQTETLRMSAELLAEWYASVGKFAEAYKFQKVYQEQYAKFQNSEKNKAVENLKIKYETSQRESENELLRSKVEVNESLIERQRLYILLASVLILFVLVVLYLIYRNYRLESKRKALIQTQARRLEEMDSYKSKFFANVSHDLRTPLTLIKSRVEALQNDEKSFLSEQAQDILLKLKMDNEQLVSFADDIQQLIALEEDKLNIQYQKIHVSRFFQTIIKLFKSFAEMRGVRLSFDSELTDDVVAHLDVENIQRVAYNLLNNAFKFTPQGGSISWKIAPEQNGFTFIISDTGIGLEDKLLPRVFERYYQADNQARPQEGLGIGLSFVREVVELHGGTITVKSVVGHGTTFRGFIPYNLDKKLSISEEDTFEYLHDRTDRMLELERLNKNQDSAVLSSRAWSGNPIVLIVDDHAEVREYIGKTLEEDYHILQASNGREALSILEKRRVDLVVTDLMMPYLDGFGLMDAMRNDPRFSQMPTMVVSARMGDDERSKVLKKGVNDFLSKPFDRVEMKARIANLLSSKGQRLFESEDAESEIRRSVLDRLHDYLIQNIDRQTPVTELAEELLTSTRNLYRMIKELTGKTPLEYQKQCRFEYVKEKVAKREVNSVKEAAALIGMKNTTYFKKQFEERFGANLIKTLD
ncbi:MAG: tetratricopeptide repeat protein [Cyclobacteriaceae bacterium]